MFDNLKSPRPVSRQFSKRLSKLFDHDNSNLRSDSEIEQLECEIRELHEGEEMLKEKYNELESEIEMVKQRLTERQHRRKQLNLMMNELAITQKFLSTADSLSQAEVVMNMKALNDEIFVLAAVVADRVQLKDQRYLPGEEQTIHRRLLPESSLGSGFLDIVMHRKLEDPLAIQIGSQAILAHWCSRVIRALYLGGNEELHDDMNRLYGNIQLAYEQVIVGGWRSLTIAATDELSSDDRERLISNITTVLVALPVVCGYIFNKEAFDELATESIQRLGPLLDKCLKLRKMVLEGITSKDISSYAIDSGAVYDPNYADLEYEEEEDSTSTKKEGVVACTVALGLYAQKRDDKGVQVREMILKSKVILQDTLIEIVS